MQIESISSEPRVPQRSIRQTALLAQMPSRSKSKEEYFAAWEAWAQQPNRLRDENRKEAVMRMRAWLKTDKPTKPLVLNGLTLRSLPVLPDSVQNLHVSHNQLSSWPMELPSSLRYLDVSYNQLTSVPEHITTKLKNASINLENNRLHEHVISNLHAIISAPSYHGPDFILQEFTQRESNQEFWGAWEAWAQEPNHPRDENRNAAFLRVKGWLTTNNPTNRLTLSGLNLRSLPALPDLVHKVDLSHNQLTSWPEDLLPSLEFLDLSHNQLTSVPDGIARTMKENAQVYLRNNPFPRKVIKRLGDMTSDLSYKGPSIFLRTGGLTPSEESHIEDAQLYMGPELADSLRRSYLARP